MVDVGQFEKDLASILNAHGIDNRLDIPDYLVAKYLRQHLENLLRLKVDIESHEETLLKAVANGTVEGDPDLYFPEDDDLIDEEE